MSGQVRYAARGGWAFVPVLVVLSFIATIIPLLGGGPTRVVSMVFTNLMTFFKEYMRQVVEYVGGLLPQDAIAFLNAAETHLDTLKEPMDQVNYIVPIYSIASVLMATLGMVATIRLVKRIVDFVPGVSLR